MGTMGTRLLKFFIHSFIHACVCLFVYLFVLPLYSLAVHVTRSTVPGIFHRMNESVIMFCPKDFPTEIGAKLTRTPPPPSPHRPEGQPCYVIGLGHYNLFFQISPQSLFCSSGGLGFLWLGEVWGSQTHRCPPIPLPPSLAQEVSRGYVFVTLQCLLL